MEMGEISFSLLKRGKAFVHLLPKSLKKSIIDYLHIMKNSIFTLGLLFSSFIGLSQSAKEYYEKGVAKYANQDYMAAIRSLNQAIKLNPNYAEAYHLRGNARMRSFNQNEKAASDYTMAIKLDPSNVKSYNNRGLVKSALGDYDGAIEDYNKALELDSKAIFVYRNRGDTKKLTNDLSGALADYEKASEIELEKKSGIESENKGTDSGKASPAKNALVLGDTAKPEAETNIQQKGKITKGIVVDMSAFNLAEEEIIAAGAELRAARKVFGAGIFFNLVGGGLLAGSAFATEAKVQTGLLIAGTVFSVVGTVVTLCAIIPVGEAGKRLQKVRFPRTVRVEIE
jgi:tetratricopeptide (TPR) repeat protein